jgi:D-alanine--D-alanine ligase
MNLFKIALLTGGPSLERGISLNSARSVLDHLDGDGIDIIPIYFDTKKRAYKISKSQLYSNTPSDFDFKLAQNSSVLSNQSLIKLLKSVDIVFPAMHGPFGEDGQIQSFLEKNNIPFVGSGSKACKMAFDKYEANRNINASGFFTLPSELLKIYDKNNSKIIKDFFKKYKIKRAIVKPATGGSSIGVFSVSSPEEAIKKTNIIFSKRMDTKVVLEPFAEGKEFTVIILQNKLGMPVAVVPSEIEMAYHEGRIFDFRKKYLPTNQVQYHCPPRFSNKIIKRIQTEAEQLFSFFGMNDFARFDGWILDNGEIWFSDFNTVSGMEQNSFLFQQASVLGMSHRDLLNYVVKNSCNRQNIKFTKTSDKVKKRKPISVIFGGTTSERQVSLMSGTNVWLKLKKSKTYEPKPYLLGSENNVWELPYSLILNHTVEEIVENAKNAENRSKEIEDLISEVKRSLILSDEEMTEPYFKPKAMSLEDMTNKSKFIFLGLHGGDGENGNIQEFLTDNKVKYNGSGKKTSSLCMDKFKTGEFIRSINMKGIDIAYQKVVHLKELDYKNTNDLWNNLKKDLRSKTIIVKPKDDGCSTGVAHLYNNVDLKNYLLNLKNNSSIPAGTLKNQDTIIEMPNIQVNEILFEKFIDTDIVKIKGSKIKHIRKSGWVEVTIGILERNTGLYAFNPSITIAEGEVLSLEEKFQGGTGVNITPPPKQIIRLKAVARARHLAVTLATKIGIKGYARIDAFMNTITGALCVIEVNTLPGLTPSTVLYHQALAENPQIFPLELLEKIIKNSGY